MENGLLTPTFKASALPENSPVSRSNLYRKLTGQFLITIIIIMYFQIKRPQAKAYFEKAILKMNAELATPDPSPKL